MNNQITIKEWCIIYTIIPLLLAHIQELNKQILFLFNFIVKNIPLKFKEKDDSLFSPKYNKLKVDKLPIIHVPEHVHCPCCNAPHNYIYDNTGGRGQFWCKVCDTHFNRHNYLDNPIELHCPHCGGALSVVKNRKLFNIHKCMNKKCSYYQNSLNSLSKKDLEEYKSKPEKFKLHFS